MTKTMKKARFGRPPLDPNAPLPPTLPIGPASRRYRVGRDQLQAAAVRGEVPAICLNGRYRIITSKADEMFGITA